MNTETQFLSFLRARSINYKLYDYIDGQTTDKYIENHPTVIRFRRFYENPFFWNMILKEKKLQNCMTFFIETYAKFADKTVIVSIIPNINRINKSILYNKVIKEQLINSENKEEDADSYLLSVLREEKEDIFNDLLKIIMDLNIEPKYKTFGNIGNGEALSEMAKVGNEKLLLKLIELGVNPELDDSMSYVMAIKHGFYKVALLLKESGANIYTRNNLGLKTIERNDKKNMKLSEENKKARKQLLELYEKNINK